MLKRLFVPIVSAYNLHAPPRLRKFRVLKWLARFCDGESIKTPRGPVIRLNSDDDTNLFALYGVYNSVETNLEDNLTEGDWFFDIGANLGYFSLLASEKVGPSGHVIAFEPSARELASLARNIFENRCRNVTVLGLALSDETVLADFSPGPASHTGTGSLTVDGQGTQSVLCLCLGDWFSALKKFLDSHPLVIKIDVEGAELQVLRSIRDLLEHQNFKALVIEIHKGNLSRFGSTPEDIYSYLFDLGLIATERQSGDWYDELFKRK